MASWYFFICLLLGIAAALLAVLVLVLWCADALCCLPRPKFLMPQLEDEAHLAFVGDAHWRDTSSSRGSHEVSVYKEKHVPLSSRDSETRAARFSGNLSQRLLETLVKLAEWPQRNTAPLPATLPTPSVSSTADTGEHHTPATAQPDDSPSETHKSAAPNPSAEVSAFSQRRRRRVQLVLGDDVTDRYVPSSEPILANAMLDVAVAPVRYAVLQISSRPEAHPHVERDVDEVEVFPQVGCAKESDHTATTTHRAGGGGPAETADDTPAPTLKCGF